MRFILTIDLGNSDMATDADIADALSDVQDRLDRRHGDVEDIAGFVKDINGNTVGKFGVLSEDTAYMLAMRDLARHAIDTGVSCESTVVGDVAAWEIYS